MISKLLKKNEKGFTLMEMLIVVAIIAVLVAIAIPTFKSSLDKARVATDTANIRAGYAAAMTEMLLNDAETITGTYYLKSDGTVTTTQNDGDYRTLAKNDTAVAIAGQKPADAAGYTWDKGQSVTYTFASGALTITFTTPTGE